MKAEIVTFVRAYNYGAVLQCYALSKVLKDMGIQPEVLDYSPDYFEAQYSLRTQAPLRRGFRHPRLWLLRLYGRAVAWIRSRRFDRFLRKHLPLSKKQYRTAAELEAEPPACDCYITGSDQVWNSGLTRFDPVFFLDFPAAQVKPRYSYAASFGMERIPEKFRSAYARRLDGFSGYSVREKSGVEMLGDLLDVSAEVCCDPTLLLDRSDWEAVAAENRERQPYILIYYVYKTQKLQEYAMELAKQKNMKVICVPCNMALEIVTGWADRRYGVDVRTCCAPEEVLSLFRNADYVLTNSFHGTVFSLMFQKQFLVQTELGNGKKNTRVAELLAVLGISGRELGTNASRIDEALPWQDITRNRQVMKEIAMAYLGHISGE